MNIVCEQCNPGTGTALFTVFLALSARNQGKKVIMGNFRPMDYQYLTEVEFMEELDKVMS